MVLNNSFIAIDCVIQGRLKNTLIFEIKNNVLTTLKILNNSTRTHKCFLKTLYYKLLKILKYYK